jgi:hypothetical protein
MDVQGSTGRLQSLAEFQGLHVQPQLQARLSIQTGSVKQKIYYVWLTLPTHPLTPPPPPTHTHTLPRCSEVDPCSCSQVTQLSPVVQLPTVASAREREDLHLPCPNCITSVLSAVQP